MAENQSPPSGLSPAPEKPAAKVVSPVFADNPQTEFPAVVQPSESNEPATRAKNPSENNLGQKIRRATASVINRAGQVFKKGRGRPRNCELCEGAGCESCDFSGKQPGKLDVPISQGGPGGEIKHVPPLQPAGGLPEGSPMAAESPAPAPDTSRASLFRRSVVSAARSIIKILTGIVRVYADAAEIDPKFTDRALSRCEPSADALDRWTESLDVVLKKHQVEPKHAEEISLAVNTAELLAPFGILIAEFKGEIRRRRDRERAHE